MNDFGVSDLPPGLESLARALCAWVRLGNSARLERWFARELEADGAPIRLSIPDWRQCVRGLAEARHCRPGWSKRVDRHALALLRSLLRFSRPAGTPTTDFDAVELDASYRTSLAQLARAYARSGEARVIGWWLSLPDAWHVPPPLPPGRAPGMCWRFCVGAGKNVMICSSSTTAGGSPRHGSS